jgi:hypothetical protein
VNCVVQSQVRGQWQKFVMPVMNFRVAEPRTLQWRRRIISLLLFQCARVRAGDYWGVIRQLKSDCIKCWQLKSGELSRITQTPWCLCGVGGREGCCSGSIAATALKPVRRNQTHVCASRTSWTQSYNARRHWLLCNVTKQRKKSSSLYSCCFDC